MFPAQRVAFSYPKGWSLRAPVNGLTGTGDGAAFCNIFRVPGAAPAGASTPGIVRYARAQLRAWKRNAHGVVAGRCGRSGARGWSVPPLWSGTRHTRYAKPGAWRSSHPDGVLRIECSAPPASFKSLDRRAFRPFLHSFRTLRG